MADLLAWCFHSPRRLAAVLVGVLALLIGAGAAVNALLPDGPPAPSRGGSAEAAGSPDAGPASAAALAFTRVWASKPAAVSDQQWRASIAPLATAELARGLALTDPAGLPGGVPQGAPTIRFVSVSSALLEVGLSTGRRVLVTVVLVNGRWLASDVQPLAGDSGDVPASAASVSASAG